MTAHIHARDVRLSFPLINNAGSIRKTIVRLASFGRLQKDAQPDIQAIHALNGVSFSAEQGDRVGLIGSNGAGKTTLLKVLAGIYTRSGGSLDISGSVEALTSLGFGVEPEETGEENIRFVLRVLGTPKSDLAMIEKEIIDFTELGEFIKFPVRTYSQGMTTRLGFALATVRRPEILLLDEVVGAGDARFYQKASRRLQDLTESTKIMFLASHSNQLIQEWCNKVIWLENGLVKKIGPTQEVLDAYIESETPN